MAPHAIKNNARKYKPLVSYFEYLKNLGEVRATRVVAQLLRAQQAATPATHYGEDRRICSGSCAPSVCHGAAS